MNLPDPLPEWWQTDVHPGALAWFNLEANLGKWTAPLEGLEVVTDDLRILGLLECKYEPLSPSGLVSKKSRAFYRINRYTPNES